MAEQSVYIRKAVGSSPTMPTLIPIDLVSGYFILDAVSNVCTFEPFRALITSDSFHIPNS